MKKINSSIIQVDFMEIKDDKNGTVTDMTKIVYTVDRENTDRHVGPALLECYRQGNLLNKLKPYVMQKSVIEIEERMTKKGSNYVVTKVNDVSI